MKKQRGGNQIGKELRQMRNLLILVALKSGATAKEVEDCTGMGSENEIRIFAPKKGRRKTKKPKMKAA